MIVTLWDLCTFADIMPPYARRLIRDLGWWPSIPDLGEGPMVPWLNRLITGDHEAQEVRPYTLELWWLIPSMIAGTQRPFRHEFHCQWALDTNQTVYAAHLGSDVRKSRRMPGDRWWLEASDAYSRRVGPPSNVNVRLLCEYDQQVRAALRGETP